MKSLVEDLQNFRDFSKKTFGVYPKYVTLKHIYASDYSIIEISKFKEHLESDGTNHFIFKMKIRYVSAD